MTTTNKIKISEAVKQMQEYWNTYDQQSGYENYRPETFIDDALYAIGLAIDEDQFQFAQGFDKFKVILRDHLSCKYCDGSGEIETDNNGPIVGCPVCSEKK